MLGLNQESWRRGAISIIWEVSMFRVPVTMSYAHSKTAAITVFFWIGRGGETLPIFYIQKSYQSEVYYQMIPRVLCKHIIKNELEKYLQLFSKRNILETASLNPNPCNQHHGLLGPWTAALTAKVEATMLGLGLLKTLVGRILNYSILGILLIQNVKSK